MGADFPTTQKTRSQARSLGSEQKGLGSTLWPPGPGLEREAWVESAQGSWGRCHSAERHLFLSAPGTKAGYWLTSCKDSPHFSSAAHQVSPQHPPLWKPHQHVHREAWDPPSHLLCLFRGPSECSVLSPGPGNSPPRGRSGHWFSWGWEGHSWTQTQRSLCSQKTEVDSQQEAVARGRSEWASVSHGAVDCPQMGWEGEERGDELAPRAWSLGFCHQVLSALVRLI